MKKKKRDGLRHSPLNRLLRKVTAFMADESKGNGIFIDMEVDLLEVRSILWSRYGDNVVVCISPGELNIIKPPSKELQALAGWNV